MAWLVVNALRDVVIVEADADLDRQGDFVTVSFAADSNTTLVEPKIIPVGELVLRAR